MQRKYSEWYQQYSANWDFSFNFWNSVVRLCKARAKLECRKQVTENDVREVIALYNETFFEVVFPNSGDGAKTHVPKNIKGKGGKITKKDQLNLM